MKYTLAKKLFATALKTYYSKVSTNGFENIPRDQPVLFISNHNNAFIDPLLLAATLDRRITFTAKSTLAKNPLLNIILKSFSVELLSRKIDRSQNESGRSFNTSAFQRLEDKLHERSAVYIFPEGKSHNDPVLHKFKTGAARLALAYAESCAKLDKRNDLLIIPLGLHYSDKSTFRSHANIQVGEPLSLKAWLTENAITDIRALTDQFKMMVANSLDDQRRTIRKAALTVGSPSIKSSFGDRYRYWEKHVLGAPLGLLGGVLNLLPFAITAFFRRKLSTESDHPASAAIVVGPPVFTIAHSLQLTVLGALGSIFLVLLYILMLIPSSVLALKVFDHLFHRNARVAL